MPRLGPSDKHVMMRGTWAACPAGYESADAGGRADDNERPGKSGAVDEPCREGRRGVVRVGFAAGDAIQQRLELARRQ